MSNKVGRPKNPRIKAFENKIERLEQEIKTLKENAVNSIDGKELNFTSIGWHFDNEKRTYILDVIKYDPVTKVGKVIKTLPGGDTKIRVEFEIKKFIAHNL